MDRTFAQMWELCFKPELERRQNLGEVSTDFHLYLAQALFPPEGQTQILFNDEVKGEGRLRASRDVKEGDAIYSDDLQNLEIFDLPDEMLDNGRFTIVRSGDGWKMFFNFLSGRAKARDMLDLASQFFEAACASREKGYSGPAIDNLFSASELISKAELILLRSRAVEAKKHSAVASEINIWARLGNIDTAFVALFNKLGQQRPSARYGNKSNRPPLPDLECFDLVGPMIDRGLARTAKTTGRPDVDRTP